MAYFEGLDLSYLDNYKKYIFEVDIDIFDTTGDQDILDEIEIYEVEVEACSLNEARKKAGKIGKELAEDFNIVEIDGFARADVGYVGLDSQEGVKLLEVQKIKDSEI